MRGQAFVHFEDVNLATRALRDTNGYRIEDRPIVVVFIFSIRHNTDSRNHCEDTCSHISTFKIRAALARKQFGRTGNSKGILVHWLYIG